MVVIRVGLGLALGFALPLGLGLGLRLRLGLGLGLGDLENGYVGNSHVDVTILYYEVATSVLK